MTKLSDVIYDAIEQARGPGWAVSIDRRQFHHLLRARDSKGKQAVSIHFDRYHGISVHFMGNPVIWQPGGLN